MRTIVRQSNLPAKFNVPIILLTLSIVWLTLSPVMCAISAAQNSLSSIITSLQLPAAAAETAEGLDSHEAPRVLRQVLLVASNHSIAAPCNVEDEEALAAEPLAPTIKLNFCPQVLHLVSCQQKDFAGLNSGQSEPLWLRLQVMLI